MEALNELHHTDSVGSSSNLPTYEHALVYLGTCFIEGTTISEGRGTNNPF